MSLAKHFPRKRLGQHWLKDNLILNKIIKAAELTSDDRVLEIGPGKGSLTHCLLSTSINSLYAIELDKNLIQGLNNRFACNSRFSLLQGDFLTPSLFSFDQVNANKVVANIPYNITGPILDKLLGSLGSSQVYRFDRLVLLMQKEVADRILAKPGQSIFSALTVRIQLLSKCKDVCSVPPSCFYPPPKVHSKVVVFEPLPDTERLSAELEIKIDHLLTHAFRYRRKKLRNSLLSIAPLDVLSSIAKDNGFTLDQRPQELSKIQWVDLANKLILKNIS